MTKLPSSSVIIAVSVTTAILLILSSPAHSLGSSSTLAVTSAGPTVCGVVSSSPTSSITCYSGNRLVPVLPNVSFSAVSGSGSTLCGVRSGDDAFFCWDTTNLSDPRRVYYNASATVLSLSVGDDQICATLNDTAAATFGSVKCWRGNGKRYPTGSDRFDSISSGSGFFCGILSGTGGVRCWGSDQALVGRIQDGFAGAEMASIACGGAHACGLDADGLVTCRGDNSSGQLAEPGKRVAYTQVSAGSENTCGIRAANGSVTCWGGGFRGGYYNNVTNGVSFTTIASGSNFTCGVVAETLSVACWGPGWTRSGYETVRFNRQILPGPCVADDSSCGGCGVVPSSRSMCSGDGVICQRCNPGNAALAPSPEISPSPAKGRSKTLTTGLLVFAVVGSVGAFSGICTVMYCLWTGVCFGKKKVHNSVQPTITRGGSTSSNSNGNSRGGMFSRSSTIRRQSSRVMRRQRSGTSSKHADHRAEEFSLAELVEATDGFALQNKIGSGSFGVVYRGKLRDGREVAIKRGEMGIINRANKNKKLQEKENAFESELSFLSRLHHKHLVRLVGYCEDGEERLLVYDYMKNGTLYDHLHDKNNLEKSSSLINSWKIRIKIALDAARGIEYLHSYAVPPIIHRDIKSSNILLDGSWTARVSDFGLSLMGGEQSRPMKAAGTVGYIDPEYYGLNVLTAKSDVYGFGVVLLEIITGRRAIFKGDDEGEDGGNPTSLVDFAVPKIMVNELVKILDPRVGPPEINEAEAVELVANIAMHCVHLEGKDRPTMSDIVSSLERALALCDDGTHGSISSGIISLVSD